MSKCFRSIVSFVLLVAVLVVPQNVSADLVPSKTAPEQSLASREADLKFVRGVVAQERVAVALANQGFTSEEVNERLAQLSDQELHSLAQNL
ncbi:MAG TPA: PA2779 family protein, partial [Thermoanaerobaculia bacterium]